MVTSGEFDTIEDLWGRGGIRVFISHKAEDKEIAKEIKLALKRYGIASFVAHEDIEPMKEWENEIERALFSADILLALLSERFSESNWTDQEVGVAVGRNIPIIPVRMGKDPYGFMGKYQAISGSNNASQIASTIFEFALSYGGLRASATDAYIIALENSGSFNRSNFLAGYLPRIVELSQEQEVSLVEAFNNNNQVCYAFEMIGVIVGHLGRLTENDYVIEDYQLRLLDIDELPR